MSEKPGKIDWKKRLEAMKPAPSVKPPQSVALPPEPPVQELPGVEAVPPNRLESPGPKPEAVQEVKPEVQEVKPIEVSRELPLPGPDPQGGRVDRLERQLRNLKVMALVAAFIAIIALLGLAFMIKRAPGRVAGMSAESLSINDTKGMCRAWLGERDGQVRLELRDQEGRQRLCLGLGAGGGPRLTFYDKDQKVLGEILPLPDGQSGIQLVNPVGEPVAAMPAPSPPALSPPPPVSPAPQAIAPLPPPVPQPQVVPQEVPQVGQKSAVPSGDPSKAEAAEFFLASPGGKAYHLPSCPWVKNIPPNQLLKFSSAAEAAKAGFHPCRRCRPDLKH